MEHSYKILGGDGNEYGPHPLSTLQTWITEGRMARDTQVGRSDGPEWKPAASFSELSFDQSPFAAGAAVEVTSAAQSSPPPVPTSLSGSSFTPLAETADPELMAKVKSASGWFFWIAALSVVNTISALAGSDWRFIIGTGITEIFNAIGHQEGGAVKIVAVILDAIYLGFLVMLGIFAGKCHRWAFIVGMIVYAIDGAIFVLAGDWISIAFHAYVLYCLFIGFKAVGGMKEA